jgi:hypothetical protein
MMARDAPISFSLFRTGLGFVFERCLARQDEVSEVESPLPLKLGVSARNGKAETGADLMVNMTPQGALAAAYGGRLETLTERLAG